jgi:hypothetical protein
VKYSLHFARDGATPARWEGVACMWIEEAEDWVITDELIRVTSSLIAQGTARIEQ